MSRISIGRKKARLKNYTGIRARLVLLALILVAPLMVERVRSLEGMRSKTIAMTNSEFTRLAQHTANAQREVISSVEAVLKSASYIYGSALATGHACEVVRKSLHVDLPWVRNLLVLDRNGKVTCSTVPNTEGLDLGDRPYFKEARDSGEPALSGYIFSRVSKLPTMVAATPVSESGSDSDAVIIAGIKLDWMSKVMDALGGRPGISATMVDSEGTVVAAPSDQASLIGHKIDNPDLLPAIKNAITVSKQDSGSIAFAAADGTPNTVSYANISGTQSRLIVRIDEARVLADLNREIHTAYIQLGFVCLFVLLGALVAAEHLIVKPINLITAMATRFGRGDRSARAERAHLPQEFIPLAKAFNAMAAQLAQRERDLIATNDRLTVMASIDVVSGLANRRGFQSRLDFEWFKALQVDGELAMLMIDVDHFKLYNDTYGHPQGDACLRRLGEVLNAVAIETMGFAARYGGEEFCLLLPDTGAVRAREVGEMARAAVERLAIPHRTGDGQSVTVSVGVSCTHPSDAQQSRDLIEASDAALYAAKHRGRNTVVEHGFVRIDDAGMKLAG